MKSFAKIVNNFKEVEHLNSLIRLNHDRLTCYAFLNNLLKDKKAVEPSLTFLNQITECISNIDELSGEVRSLGGVPSISCTLLGSFFLFCMEIRVLFSRDQISTALNCCEQINSMAMNGYTFIQTNSISEKIKMLLNNQRMALKSSFNILKSFKNKKKQILASYLINQS